MHVIPYRSFHVSALTIQNSQQYMSDFIKPEYCKALEQAGPAYTVMDDGEVIACAGLAEQWPTRATAWTLISDKITGLKFARLHKMVLRFLDMQDYLRIEMTVDHEFEQGHRWAKLLGFQWEGLMRKYNPNGCDCDLYSRVK